VTAHQLYQPVFEFVCESSRLARNDARLDPSALRRRALEILSAIADRARRDPLVAEHVQKLHTPVKHFIDGMMARHVLDSPQSEEWHENRLGYEASRHGDQAFFDSLREALREPPSPAAAERLMVYFTCLGLGFKGIESPARIRELMDEIKPKIRHFLDLEEAGRLSPAAYRGLDGRDLVRPPRERKLATAAAVICALLAGGSLYVYAYLRFNQNRPDELRQIVGSSQDFAPWTSSEEGRLPEDPSTEEAE
jgi:type VI protein secretion system component VasF